MHNNTAVWYVNIYPSDLHACKYYNYMCMHAAGMHLNTTDGTPSSKKYDVFISCPRDSAKSLVDQIQSQLKEDNAQVEVFVDRSCLQPGDKWPAEIANAISTCRAFVAVLTKKFVESVYCHAELYEAESLQKPIFPVVFERGWDQEPGGQPVQEIVSGIQYAVLEPTQSETQEYKDQLQHLVKKIGKVVKLKLKA